MISQYVLNYEQQYNLYFAQNDPKKGGSFYVQSKIFRAKEALEKELNPTADTKQQPSGEQEKKKS
jgi:import inner membrane translocase subunit TIM16